MNNNKYLIITYYGNGYLIMFNVTHEIVSKNIVIDPNLTSKKQYCWEQKNNLIGQESVME